MNKLPIYNIILVRFEEESMNSENHQSQPLLFGGKENQGAGEWRRMKSDGFGKRKGKNRPLAFIYVRLGT